MIRRRGRPANGETSLRLQWFQLRRSTCPRRQTGHVRENAEAGKTKECRSSYSESINLPSSSLRENPEQPEWFPSAFRDEAHLFAALKASAQAGWKPKPPRHFKTFCFADARPWTMPPTILVRAAMV